MQNHGVSGARHGTRADLSVAVTGSGGSGAVTTGLVLLEAAGAMGLYGLMSRSSGPQIRGGESAALLRFSDSPVDCLGDCFNILVGLDWLNVQRFVDEIPLAHQSLILADPAAGSVPGVLTESGATVIACPLYELARSVPGGRVNMVALGVLGRLTGFSADALKRGVGKVLSRKGRETVDAACSSIELGAAQTTLPEYTVQLEPKRRSATRWSISGNEAAGLGALRGGVRFVAAYPITPASEILEWLAPNLERSGGALLQAEDELASINMVIGASFGGVPSLTATSGPGLSLMVEGLGLAVASEIPLVVVNVMRGGPSTGIPTKSEQSDLNIALYGLHGDAPHLVLAPLSISDCVVTTQWAVELAEQLQAPAIVLSDQSLGQSRAVTDEPVVERPHARRRLATDAGAHYLRYEITADGVSAMALPGLAGGMYTADGLEHDERGVPSSAARRHKSQSDKRLRKLERADFGDAWADISGSGAICILTWGSVSGVALEAAARLEASGMSIRVVALRLIAPLQRVALRAVLDEVERVLVVEQNHGAQLFHYLHAEQALPDSAESLARPGPLPIRPAEIIDAIRQGG
jgi:2-oxoglutarate ferredoxin oxidoreductase subunit alpha